MRFLAVAFVALYALSLSAPLAGAAEPAGKHLFILSGQSNMAGLNPAVSFTPAVEQEFGAGQVLVVKDARGGQPIRQWFKQWKPATGKQPQNNGALYKRLMAKVSAATQGQQLQSVTFVWMQGERDAREKHGEVYAASLQGLIQQLRDDLKRDDINFVIGRLSDFSNNKLGHWSIVRTAQAEVAASSPRGALVDTDDLNGPKNGLHYTSDGYKTLGERFAQQAISLVKKHPAKQ